MSDAYMTTLPIPHRPVAKDDALPAWLLDLFERSSDLICIHDLNGRILGANPSACHALGYTIDELKRMNIAGVLHQDARFLFDPYIETLLEAGAATGQMEVRTHAGERRLWEYRNALAGDGAAVVVGIARDVTEQAETFRAVSDSENHFRTLVEHGPDLIGIVGTDGSICYFSPTISDTLHYDPRECLGQPLETFVHADDHVALRQSVARAFTSSAMSECVEIRMRSKTGSYRSCEVVLKALVRGRRTTGLLLNARDITDRKLLEQQLEQAARLSSLGRLAATVAHEFNNVLMGMMPFAELLQRGDPTSQLLGHATRHLINSIHRGKAVTRDMLRFTRPAEPRIGPLPLREWWERFRPEADALLGNDVTLSASIEPVTILADGDQLSQIFANLVSNAHDAMTGGGLLTIRARVPDRDQVFSFGVLPDLSRFVHLSVEDSGAGMSPDVLRHVFEPLFTTKTHGGTGLGLAVAHQVVTRHGGFIFAESKIGRGTTFHIFLPKAEAPATPAAAERPGPVVHMRRVLLVEDETPIAEGLVALLEDQFEITVASSGDEALAMIGAVAPDVVVLDIGLPDMDGTDVARLIRDVRPDVPIIFATGHGDSRHVAIGPRVRLLYKPFEVEDLLALMAELESEAAP